MGLQVYCYRGNQGQFRDRLCDSRQCSLHRSSSVSSIWATKKSTFCIYFTIIHRNSFWIIFKWVGNFLEVTYNFCLKFQKPAYQWPVANYGVCCYQTNWRTKTKGHTAFAEDIRNPEQVCYIHFILKKLKKSLNNHTITSLFSSGTPLSINILENFNVENVCYIHFTCFVSPTMLKVHLLYNVWWNLVLMTGAPWSVSWSWIWAAWSRCGSSMTAWVRSRRTVVPWCPRCYEHSPSSSCRWRPPLW